MNDYLTVEQLIKKLEGYPKDLLVLVDGYEDGYDGILDIKNIDVKYDNKKEWWYGRFEEMREEDIKAIRIVSGRTSS